MRPGDFTTAGHFIVLTGTQDGLLCVVDPNSPAPQRIPVGVQPFGAADQKPVGLYRMKQGRHKIYRMSFLNNDVKTANL